MAQNKFALARYHLIDQLLHASGYVKSSQMVEHCIQRTGFTITSRTIQLDIEAMKHDSFLGFYAPISYCKSRKAYYYTDPEYRLTPLQKHRKDVERLKDILLQYKETMIRDHYREIMHIILKISFVHPQK